METLQDKAFWKLNRAILENQPVALENHVEIASGRKKNETARATPRLSMFQRHLSENRPEINENLKNRKSLWSYTCSGFSCFLLKIEPGRDGKKSLWSYTCSGFSDLQRPPETKSGQTRNLSIPLLM